MKPKIEEKEKFTKIILELVQKDRIGYIDAITEYCEDVGLEIDVAAKLATPFLVSKIAEEARKNNMLERIPVLPI